jgi:glycerol-3-phosphate dehydrogenase
MNERTRLSPARRTEALRAATDGIHDLVVVGAGVTGAGVALDAAARGLSVVLLEAGDIAAGTSSRSGKTVHGGLRYLEQLNFSLVAGALRERDLMIRRLAPHLVTAEPFLFPLTTHWQRPYIGAGVALYDAMAAAAQWRGRSGGGGGVPHHRHLSRRGALRAAPVLAPGAITGALQYYDGRMDDARHTLAVARTASGCGAHVVSRARVVDVVTGGGRVEGVVAEDVLTGERHDVRARAVVNAAGVWAAKVQAMAAEPTFAVRPAKGVHLLFPREAFDSSTGVLARAEDSVIICRRWFGHWLLGTTDTAYDGDLARPTVERADVDYLLRNINRYLARPLTTDQALGAFAGLRPLLVPVSGDRATTSALSRDHTVVEAPVGLVTIVGGKYTTYRTMASDAVDACAGPLGRTLPTSTTADLPLVGAAGWPEVRNGADALAAACGVAADQVRRMLGRYGDEVPDVLAPVRSDPALGAPLAGAPGYLAAEFLYAATHEQALTLTDVLTRRTHVAIEQRDGGERVAPEVAALVAPVLGWDADRQRREVADHLASVRADRAALT